jgi:hypothetical protein
MSLQLLRTFEQANNGIAALVERALDAFLASLDSSRPELVQAALFEYVPVLVAEYGDMAATVAAEWFDELRAAEGVRGSFRAALAPLTPVEQVARRLGFATRVSGPLFTGDFETLTAFLKIMTNEYVLQPGRETVMQSAHRDNAAYARVPEPGACDFCLMLASRGFVYSSERAATVVIGTRGASQKRKIGEEFHGHCRCNIMPVWDETRARVEYGYDPDALYDQYRALRDAK